MAICRHQLSKVASGCNKSKAEFSGLFIYLDKLESTMSIKKLTGVALIVAAALTSTAAFAAGSHTLMNGKSVFGIPTSADSSAKVLDVNTTKSMEVICGDVVTVRNGDKTFTWKFDVIGHRTVDLQKIAPAGFTSKPLMVYVERNESERS